MLGGLRDAFVGRRRIPQHLSSFYFAASLKAEAVGFKLMVSQLRRHSAIMSTLLELNVRFLYLYREDALATALSHCRAKATGVFHSDRASGMPERLPVFISEGEFGRILKKCKSDKDELFRLHRIHGGLLTRYEDMIANWDAYIAKLGVELGIQGLHLSEALSKLKSGVDSARIANEDALLAKFGDASRAPASVERRG